MTAVAIRSIEIFAVLLIVTRCMGKREIGSLQPFEFVLSMMMANLATMPLADVGIPLWEGILPLLVLLILQVLLSWFSLKSQKFQTLVCGQPVLVITHGCVNAELLESLRYSMSDLMAQIRTGGLSGPQEVEYAVLETNGTLSIIPRDGFAQVTRGDLELPPQPAVLPYSLVEDGQVMEEALQALGQNQAWLEKRLRQQGCSTVKDALFALYLPDDTLVVQKRNFLPQKKRIRP